MLELLLTLTQGVVTTDEAAALSEITRITFRDHHAKHSPELVRDVIDSLREFTSSS